MIALKTSTTTAITYTNCCSALFIMEVSKERTYKILAKSIVNKIYQPLGRLRCMVSSDEMWEYAKARAIEQVDIMLGEIPMYTGNLNPKWKKWSDIKAEIESMP